MTNPTQSDSHNDARSGYPWDMATARRFSARIDAVLSRIAQERGVTVDDLVRPLTDAEREAEEARAAAEWRAEKARVLLSRIPTEYRDAEVRTPQARRWLESYAAGVRHCGLLLHGRQGSGKTWEAYGLTRRLLLDHSVPVSVVSAPDLMAMLRPNDDHQIDVAVFKVAPVLVIDDLGAEQLTPWAAEQLFRVADTRRNQRLPFIITSNLTPAQIRERYDPRLVDRLAAHSTVIEVTGHGESLRRPGY